MAVGSGSVSEATAQASGRVEGRLYRIPFMKRRFCCVSASSTIFSKVLSKGIQFSVTHINATSIVISHDIAGAYAIADFMAMIYRGKIIMEGTPDDFRNCNDPLVKQFVEGRIDGPIKTVF